MPTPHTGTGAVVGALRPGAGPQPGRGRWCRARGLLAGAFGARQARKVREKTPAYPLQYGPPDGIGPAQGAYIMTERTEKNAFVASIMEAAAKGSVTLDRPSDKPGRSPTPRARRAGPASTR